MLSITTSTTNSLLPCRPFRSSCFTATTRCSCSPGIVSRPLYTRPNPPSPINLSCRKLPAASASSRNENACAADTTVTP